MLRAGVLVSACLLAGCLPFDGGGQCRTDDDCAGTCTNSGECVAEGATRYVRLTWTIRGEAPTPTFAAPCLDAGIHELEVAFRDDDEGLRDLAYRPVPCANGLIVFDKLHPRFERVTLVAYDANDNVLTAESATLTAGENLIPIALLP